MNIPCDQYLLSHSVEETLHFLSACAGKARILAGGSDLLLELQQGIHPPVQLLVDVTEIEELCALEIRDGALFIGASVTLSRLAQSTLVRQHAQALTDAARLMANPQVCNVATIGGNVAHALPAADGTIALMALDAQAEVASSQGRQLLPLQALFSGPGVSTLDPVHQLLVGFYLPCCQTGQASAFSRRVNPQGTALALLNAAIWLQREGDKLSDARIALGPSGPIPSRMFNSERMLIGFPPSPQVQAAVLQALLEEAHFRTSPHRATEAYRRHLAGVLLDEALAVAWQRAHKNLSV
jgi:CO/xanthine dehydrogenase FAD-binding subunit